MDITVVLKPDRVLEDGIRLFSLVNIESTYHMGRWTIKKYLKEANIKPIRLGKRLYITDKDVKKMIIGRR